MDSDDLGAIGTNTDGMHTDGIHTDGIDTAGVHAAALDNSGIPAHTIVDDFQQAEHSLETAVNDGTRLNFPERLYIAAAIVAGQALLIWFFWFLFGKLSARIKASSGGKIKPLTIRNFKILTAKQITDILLVAVRIVKYLITIFQLFITVPIVFSLFPATKELASTIFGYFLSPLKNILFGAVKYIPNLITIIIILLVTKYILRGLKYFAGQIAKEKLVIPGFFADWAWPTFNILRVILYAFTVAVVYPYLPGSESRVFQGVSVFVGIIFSLGSSSAISNLIAGLVITYMRPFKIGDRIKIKDHIGFVLEKSPFVIRIRNVKNENITLPNITVLNSDIINYNTSGEEEGLVLHVKITMGYDVPWRDVYDTLIKAAVKTPHIEENPKPYVLQTGLEDFYANYEINAYTREIDKVMLIYSLLYQNIQDEFKNAGISLYSPHYYVENSQKKAESQ
ncbi:MAG: mechanosensitive ion channel family protein [Treponema sp.]|nr:mechanosensitive ion channel family protein [Treponema sp.]